MQVVVAGGTGYLGQAVQRALLQRGHRVKVIGRRGGVLPGAALCVGDVRSMDLVVPLTGADAVVHLVGIIQEVPRDGITFEMMHSEVTRRIVRVMSVLGISRMIYVSALGTRAHAKSRYHQTKWEAERIVADSADMRYTIVRPSLLFGGGAPFFRMLAAQVRLPVTPVPGDGSGVMQPVWREDVARAIAAMLEDEAAVGQTLEIGGPERYTLNQLYDHMGRLAGKAAVRKVHIPLGPLAGVVGWGERLPGFPVTRDQLAMLGEDNVTDDVRWHRYVPEPARLGDDL